MFQRLSDTEISGEDRAILAVAGLRPLRLVVERHRWGYLFLARCLHMMAGDLVRCESEEVRRIVVQDVALLLCSQERCGPHGIQGQSVHATVELLNLVDIARYDTSAR